MLCNHHYHYRVVLEHLITPKGNWYLLSSHSQSPFLPPLPPLTTTNLPSVSMELSILDISHIIYYFLIFSKFLFYDKNGLLLQLQTKQAPVTLTLPSRPTPPHPAASGPAHPTYLSPLWCWSLHVPYWLSASCTRVSVSLASGGRLEKHCFS